MPIKYYETAWRDISNSPGWFGKLCLLALVSFIPVFGQIVAFGYLYGWAREIAWGVHAPMPAKIIDNADGKFWRRGWFVLLVTWVFALVPGVVMQVGQLMRGTGFWSLAVRTGMRAAADPAFAGIGQLVYWVGFVAVVLVGMLAWVATMRTAIYDKLSAGFQLGAVWKMFRRDTGGIVRILGMELLFSLILGIILSIVITVLVFMAVMAGVAGLVGSGFAPESLRYISESESVALAVRILASSGIVGLVCMVVALFAGLLTQMFINALIIRALGYWTRQFDVPRWRGQNDPLPFEVDEAAAAQVPRYGYDSPAVRNPAVQDFQGQQGTQVPVGWSPETAQPTCPPDGQQQPAVPPREAVAPAPVPARQPDVPSADEEMPLPDAVSGEQPAAETRAEDETGEDAR